MKDQIYDLTPAYAKAYPDKMNELLIDHLSDEQRRKYAEKFHKVHSEKRKDGLGTVATYKTVMAITKPDKLQDFLEHFTILEFYPEEFVFYSYQDLTRFYVSLLKHYGVNDSKDNEYLEKHDFYNLVNPFTIHVVKGQLVNSFYGDALSIATSAAALIKTEFYALKDTQEIKSFFHRYLQTADDPLFKFFRETKQKVLLTVLPEYASIEEKINKQIEEKLLLFFIQVLQQIVDTKEVTTELQGAIKSFKEDDDVFSRFWTYFSKHFEDSFVDVYGIELKCKKAVNEIVNKEKTKKTEEIAREKFLKEQKEHLKAAAEKNRAKPKVETGPTAFQILQEEMKSEFAKAFNALKVQFVEKLEVIYKNDGKFGFKAKKFYNFLNAHPNDVTDGVLKIDQFLQKNKKTSFSVFDSGELTKVLDLFAAMGNFTYPEEQKEKVKTRNKPDPRYIKELVDESGRGEDEDLENFNDASVENIISWLKNEWEDENGRQIKERDFKNLEKDLERNPNEVRRLYRKLVRGLGDFKNAFEKQKIVPIAYRLSKANRFVVYPFDNEVEVKIYIENHAEYEKDLREKSF